MGRAFVAGAALLVTTLVLAGCASDERPGDLRGPGWTAQPLAAASRHDGGSRFERLDAERTGIDFVHVWAPPSEHAHRLNTSATVSGVAMGDYDGDGRIDVALTSPHGGSRLYRNQGEFHFLDVTERAGLDSTSWGAGVTFVDVDNDDDLDLYVCVFEGPNKLYVNRGDGTFVDEAGPRGLGFTGASTMMAFADYDLDGDLDAYLLTNNNAPLKMPRFKSVAVDGVPSVPKRYRELAAPLRKPDGRYALVPAAQLDHLYRNDGGGTFTEVSEEAGIEGTHFGLAVTWWDYNDDGFPDLYVANDFFGPDQLYRNDGDGTFTDVAREALPHTPWFSMGVSAGDINNDGRFDLLGSDMAGSTHYKRKISTVDMEHAWFYEIADPPQYPRNALYLNSGTPRFFEAAFLTGLARTDWTWSVKMSDLDEDGRVDVFVSNGMTRDWLDGDLMVRAKNEFGRPSLSRNYVEAPPRAEANLAYRNLGDLEFEEVGRQWGLDTVGVSFGAALGDLDGDGDLDLVVNNFEERATVYRNDSTEHHRVRIRLRGTASNRQGIGAKVALETADGVQVRYLSPVRGVMSSDDPTVHFGLGRSANIERLTVTWPSGRVQELEDLEGDHLYTIVEPAEPAEPAGAASGRAVGEPVGRMFERSDALAGAMPVEAGLPDRRLQPLLPRRLSRTGPGLAWGDVDGDGDDDLYVGGGAMQEPRLLINVGRGQFEPRAEPAFRADLSCEDMAPLFLDADADGDLDLFVASGGVEAEPGAETLRDRLYVNDGDGRFTRDPSALPDFRDSGGAAVAADFDRDGDVDLFVGGRVAPGRYPLTPRSRLLVNDGKGRFADGTARRAPGLERTGMVTSAVWSDVDDDGWLDLIVTHEWGPVRLWGNREGTLFDRTAEAGLDERTGWWNGIAAGDVDNDGDIDLAVTNFGLNTPYRASTERPATLFYGDFDGTGTSNVLEAEFDGDRLVPVAGRARLSEAIPILAERFGTFDAFARAGLAEMFGQALDASVRVEATSFESGVLLNDGTGRFEFHALPRLAQVSPGFGVVLDDVDGDGNEDLYVVQNAFGPESEIGRFDGGMSLLLNGRGDGTFEPVWPDRSGLIVPGDATGLARADVDGDGTSDFVIAISDGEVVTYLSRVARAPGVRIRLRGRPGNPDAVGARVTVRLRDDSSRVAEIRAGGSYLSQSSSTVVFGLGDSGGVREIEVRWPDGQVTSHSPETGARPVVINQPAAP